jgi:hypothetical protein
MKLTGNEIKSKQITQFKDWRIWALAVACGLFRMKSLLIM